MIYIMQTSRNNLESDKDEHYCVVWIDKKARVYSLVECVKYQGL